MFLLFFACDDSILKVGPALDTAPVEVPDQPGYAADVAPLIEHCGQCHGPSGGVTVPPDYASLMQATDVAGNPLITPGNLDESVIWSVVKADAMPYDVPFSDNQKLLLQTWIETGANP